MKKTELDTKKPHKKEATPNPNQCNVLKAWVLILLGLCHVKPDSIPWFHLFAGAPFIPPSVLVCFSSDCGIAIFMVLFYWVFVSHPEAGTDCREGSRAHHESFRASSKSPEAPRIPPVDQDAKVHLTTGQQGHNQCSLEDSAAWSETSCQLFVIGPE